MITRLLLLLALATVTLAGAEQVYRGQARPVIERIELTDGRVLEQARILGDSAFTVTIAHAGRIEKIEKAVLPPDLARQWPVDQAKAAQEERDRAAAAARHARDTARAQRINEAVRREQIREAKAQQRVNAQLDAKRARDDAQEARRAAATTALRERSRDDLHLDGFTRTAAGVRLTVRNLADAPRRLDVRALRGLALDGTTLEPTGLAPASLRESAAPDLRSGESRVFNVSFSRPVLALAWADRADLGWHGADGAAVEPAAAIAAEQARLRQAAVDRRAAALVEVK